MKKILIITSHYYPEVSKKLLISAENTLRDKYKIKKINAPGSFEIPVLISKNIKRFDGFIALGCVIKGKTPHFDYICKSINYGLMKLSIESKKPIGNGILTCLNKNQAKQRVNKGSEAAKAVVNIITNEKKQ